MPCSADATEHAGQATWYELATPLVNCSYETATLPAYYGAMNTADYQDSAVCGACARVRGPGGNSIDIQIVDQCPIATNPICYAGHIDLNPPAFAALADPSEGVIPITWRFLPCDVQGGMSYRFKEGSSEYWTAILVRNHRHAIAKVEYAANGGWRELQRESYNYFVDPDGMGPGPYTLRITDIYGNAVEEAGVPLAPGATHQGNAQLPQCAG